MSDYACGRKNDLLSARYSFTVARRIPLPFTYSSVGADTFQDQVTTNSE